MPFQNRLYFCQFPGYSLPMKFFQSRWSRLASLLLIFASALRAESSPPAMPLLPPPAPPLPAVVALAAARRIPLEGIDSIREAQTLRAGDAITLLFTLVESGHQQQWLAEVKVVALSDEERRSKPSDATIYSGSGNEFHLKSAPAAFALRMFGPFQDGTATGTQMPAVAEKAARFTVKEDFLSFGFDRMCEVALRLRPIGREINLGFATGPFSKEQIGWGKQWVRDTGFTPDDELTCAKQGFATVEFLSLAQHTPGLQDIAQAAVEMPSLWSALRKMDFGKWFNYDWKKVTRLDGTPQGFSAPVYALPFGLTMFGSHVANGTWLVTAARPPLLACSGVLGLTVTPPNGKDKRLEMRLVAAHTALP